VLARAAAAEVVAGQQHLHALRLGPVEHELRVRIARGVVAPIVEKLLVETLLGGGLQDWDLFSQFGDDLRRDID
jgi:hypothetical protein